MNQSTLLQSGCVMQVAYILKLLVITTTKINKADDRDEELKTTEDDTSNERQHKQETQRLILHWGKLKTRHTWK